MKKIYYKNSEIKSIFVGGERYGLNASDFPIVLDTDAAAFLTATGITDTTITSAINTLVVDLKDNDYWNGLKAIYPMVGGTADTCKYNLKNPLNTDAAFRLNFLGGWTFDSNGAKPNGVTGTYADTFLNANTHLTTSNGSFSYYSFTNNAGAENIEIGVNTGFEITDETLIATRWTDNNTYGFYAQRGGNGGTTTRSDLFCVVNRTANFELWRNGTRVVNASATPANLPNRNFILAAQNNGATPWRNSTRGCQFSHIGATLANPATFITIVNNFQTTLGRNKY
jgi:hypothetical protein